MLMTVLEVSISIYTNFGGTKNLLNYLLTLKDGLLGFWNLFNFY